ncbi:MULTISPECIES: hydantoinase/oxoprolinase family protein [Methylomonas]|uniref:H4MPT-linked C1 transfer pathway protein n=2 Tax=Methylomonas TaxID=416 RepID=A0A126T951_9GAMM|nr:MULTISPECIES: hydantoinase/oxoprolinase family protein [Methylomonas]AMK78619.1 H4MPT-linked C1 transfer pathway protein [Methylomonas denitrificans]OAI03620.1 H4MPT-linked C1 transfer pathway protein [Methylomonas methanica]TCV83628.1 putative H4MPT-linked C1 transfer pathway protein [Methylomonas methanica]
MNKQIAGWDIGGAHVKLALLGESGQIQVVAQQACPLWKGVDYLRRTLADLAGQFDLQDCRNAVTMTGELVDCFTSREQGVNAIVQAVCEQFNAEQVSVFAGLRGFLPAAQIQPADCMDIASANWLASLLWVAKRQPNALFVDIGSTTSDILLAENHQLKVQGFTDYQRLVSGELVYTGIVRTAVMAIAQEAEFNGQAMGLMAEYFATMADVYRLTGDLNEAHDQSDTADGAEKSVSASARRLSRLTGYEFSESDHALWLAFAEQLKAKQIQKISLACARQLQRAETRSAIKLVGAGVGRFLARDIARDLGVDYLDFKDLLPSVNNIQAIDAADCAPAAAVAYLAGGFG